MSASTNEQQVLLKIFLGFHMSSEIRMLLDQGALLQGQSVGAALTLCEIQHQSKSYFGTFLAQAEISCSALMQKAEEIKYFVEASCPDIEIDSEKLFVFSQFFLS